jgi:hypothetical protein
VQLSYGDDGLDPVLMEGKGGAPLDLERLLAKVCGLGRRGGGGEGGREGHRGRDDLKLTLAARTTVDASYVIIAAFVILTPCFVAW